MRSFPYNWQRFPNTEFAGMRLTSTQNMSLGLSIMILINPNGSEQGPFWVSMVGTQLVRHITHITSSSLRSRQILLGYTFRIRAGVEPPVNSLQAHALVDLADLLHQCQATTSDANGTSVPNSDLLAFLASQPANKSGLGASIRWAVSTASIFALCLEMQALWARACYLN
jgi:hypothetical protein